MKQKKKEKELLKELQAIKDNQDNGKNVETAMCQLIQKAANFYQDQLDQNMAQFYYQYGSILVQNLEQAEDASENSNNCVEISRNDREQRDCQLAFENLETAKTILRNKLDKQNIEFYRLQELLDNQRQVIQETQLQITHVHIKIGDLQTWREEYADAIVNYNIALQNINQRYLKEMSAINYKIGNALLLENLNGCELLALKYFEQSFRICYEQVTGKACDLDISSIQKIQAIKCENELLKMLLEKIEDTIQQLNEVNQCQKEIDKWKQQQEPLFSGVVSLGKITAASSQVGDVIIKRKK